MTTAALVFTEAEVIGKVSGVDTGRVAIDVEKPELMTRLGVGNLIAIKGPTENEFLIALVERVTRSLREQLLQDPSNEEEGSIESSPWDLIKAITIGTYRIRDGEKANTFKRGADSFPQIDKSCFLIESANLQNFMNLLGSAIPVEERLNLGHFVIDKSANAIADGDKFFQRHASILGSTGSGKSWAVALLLERASKLKHPNIIVFDMHGEYKTLAGSGGFAKGFRIAGPGDLDSPKDNVVFLPYWLLNREEMLAMILDRSDQNAPNQASRFTKHVKALKEKTLVDAGKTEVQKTFTVDSPIPYKIAELMALLKKDDTDKGVGAGGKEIKGDWEGKLTRFISRLEARLDDRRYGFMFKPVTSAMSYDWLANQVLKFIGDPSGGIKIVDFSEVPSDILPIVTGTFARLLYDVQFWMDGQKRTPFAFVCDEAHLYLPTKEDADSVEKQALATFERIAKEGRKYGVAILCVSQRPADVSKTILSQCNNFLVLRLTNDKDQAVVKSLMPDSMDGITDILPLLDTGEALLLGDSILLPTRIKLDEPTIKPDSATKKFWTEWSNTSPNVDAIKLAVETLRKQSR